jgi:hypothetical protein
MEKSRQQPATLGGRKPGHETHSKESNGAVSAIYIVNLWKSSTDS